MQHIFTILVSVISIEKLFIFYWLNLFLLNFISGRISLSAALDVTKIAFNSSARVRTLSQTRAVQVFKRYYVFDYSFIQVKFHKRNLQTFKEQIYLVHHSNLHFWDIFLTKIIFKKHTKLFLRVIKILFFSISNKISEKKILTFKETIIILTAAMNIHI